MGVARNKMRTISDDPRIEPNALPCPFCGSQAEIQPWHGGKITKRMISCSNTAGTLGSAIDATCHVGPAVTGETRAEALRRWNRRSYIEEMQKRLEPK